MSNLNVCEKCGEIGFLDEKDRCSECHEPVVNNQVEFTLEEIIAQAKQLEIFNKTQPKEYENDS